MIFPYAYGPHQVFPIFGKSTKKTDVNLDTSLSAENSSEVFYHF